MDIDSIELKIMDRTVSSFPISISTARVLEALFPPKIEIYDVEATPVKIDTTVYKKHYFNVYTLVRNIVEAMSTNDRDIILANNIDEVITRILQREINEITELYSTIKIIPIIYFPKYDFYTQLPSLKQAGVKTKTFVKNTKIINVVEYIRRSKKLHNIEIEYLNNNHLPHTINSIVTTHNVIDLCYTSSSSHLLESHTGRLKDKNDLNSRYSKIKGFDNTVLPFNKTLLYLLGDGGHMITGVNISIKREILRIAYDKKWFVYTTETQVKKDIKDILNNLIKDKEDGRYWKRYL